MPLPRQALELIEALPRERRVRRQTVPNEYVFAGKGGRPIGDFSALKADLDKLSGVKDWQLQRDVRRTGATWLQDEGGFAKDDVHAVLGHSLGELQATYMAGPGYRRKKAALQAWADYVLAAVEGKADDKVVPLRAGRARLMAKRKAPVSLGRSAARRRRYRSLTSRHQDDLLRPILVGRVAEVLRRARRVSRARQSVLRPHRSEHIWC